MSHDALTEAFHDHVAAFEPEDGAELDGWLAALPDTLSEAGTSFATLAERLGSDFPVDPALVSMIHEVGQAISAAGDKAGEAYDTHRGVHEAELRRVEEPRPGEQMWNV